MADEQEGQEQVQQEEVSQEQQSSQQQANKGNVPYERLEAVSKQNQELRQKYAELEKKFAEIESPVRLSAEEQKLKADKQKFFEDPYGTLNEKVKAVETKLEREKAELQDTYEYKMALAQLQSSPEFNTDLETAMVNVIKQHGLSEFGKARALKLAYQAATGKEWGTWSKDGYSTRQVKERLARPSASGSGSGSAMSVEQFRNLSLDEYEKNPKKYNEALQAYRASLR